MSHNVRTHTRRTTKGGTTTVRQHRRRGGPNPSHAWKMAKRGRARYKRGHKGVAAGIFTFALLEVGLWAGFNILGVVCGAIGAALIGLSWVLISKRDGSR